MEILLNGERRQVDEPSTVLDLLKTLEVDPRRVAVEVNGRLVPRDRHGECSLAAGDAVEVVSFVGGG